MDHFDVADHNTTRQCRCTEATDAKSAIVKWTMAGGLLASLGVCAACRLLPFALLSVGVAGAWVSMLDALAPYKWGFIALTATLLGYGFYAAYWRPRRRCAAGVACEVCGSNRSARIGLWLATLLVIAGLVFERLEPMLTAH